LDIFFFWRDRSLFEGIRTFLFVLLLYLVVI